MTAQMTSLDAEVMSALSTVVDPELDEPITDLGFVRSIILDDLGVEVHLRLPTSFCSPNFAYLMASDALDALRLMPGGGVVRVMLDDHHDSDKINLGLATDAGYRGTFGNEAHEDLEELRATFKRKAHIASMERSCMQMLQRGTWTLEELPLLELRDLPDCAKTKSLVRRRAAIGLPTAPDSRVLVDGDGVAIPERDVPLRLRMAATTRRSIEGNAHFCRGLLATRYAGSQEIDAITGPVITDLRSGA